MKNLKITVPLVIITMIAIISVGAYLVYALVIANQSIDSDSADSTTTSIAINTSDWQIYSSTEYGIEVKYPKDWTKEESDNGSAKNINLISAIRSTKIKEDKDKIIRTFDFRITVYPSTNDLPNNSEKATFTDWLNKGAKTYGFVNSTKVTVGGKEGYRGVNSGGESTASILYFVQTGNEILEIEPYAGDQLIDKGYGRRILASLKLSDPVKKVITPAQPTPTQPTTTKAPTPVSSTANWKSYSNSEYDFSFKYPSNWDLTSPSSSSIHLDEQGNKYPTSIFGVGFPGDGNLTINTTDYETITIDGNQYTLQKHHYTGSDNPLGSNPIEASKGYVIKTDKDIDISYWYPDSQESHFAPIIKQILDTFKITDNPAKMVYSKNFTIEKKSNDQYALGFEITKDAWIMVSVSVTPKDYSGGHYVRELVSLEQRPAGGHSVFWDGQYSINKKAAAGDKITFTVQARTSHDWNWKTDSVSSSNEYTIP